MCIRCNIPPSLCNPLLALAAQTSRCGAHAPPAGSFSIRDYCYNFSEKFFSFIDWKWIYDDFFYSLRMCFWVILNIG
jgi:hypothetical protein